MIVPKQSQIRRADRCPGRPLTLLVLWEVTVCSGTMDRPQPAGSGLPQQHCPRQPQASAKLLGPRGERVALFLHGDAPWFSRFFVPRLPDLAAARADQNRQQNRFENTVNDVPLRAITRGIRISTCRRSWASGGRHLRAASGWRALVSRPLPLVRGLF
ncbi:hypothetical protein [Teichococcus vastitatis]|uniref:hypothetical protein n=1 Tax=Teichococcus vastitatis TaxID=2307076 RepID=UPI000E724BD6|nr:hypothetical protein [Pseudoroseomonas vastitatis]